MTPDKCSKCGDEPSAWPHGYYCGSHYVEHRDESREFVEHALCLTRQRDQLADENAALRERVKRLEEAGDFMELCLTHNEPFRSDAKAKWHKAKESKP